MLITVGMTYTHDFYYDSGSSEYCQTTSTEAKYKELLRTAIMEMNVTLKLRNLPELTES